MGIIRANKMGIPPSVHGGGAQGSSITSKGIITSGMQGLQGSNPSRWIEGAESIDTQHCSKSLTQMSGVTLSAGEAQVATTISIAVTTNNFSFLLNFFSSLGSNHPPEGYPNLR